MSHGTPPPNSGPPGPPFNGCYGYSQPQPQRANQQANQGANQPVPERIQIGNQWYRLTLVNEPPCKLPSFVHRAYSNGAAMSQAPTCQAPPPMSRAPAPASTSQALALPSGPYKMKTVENEARAVRLRQAVLNGYRMSIEKARSTGNLEYEPSPKQRMVIGFDPACAAELSQLDSQRDETKRVGETPVHRASPPPSTPFVQRQPNESTPRRQAQANEQAGEDLQKTLETRDALRLYQTSLLKASSIGRLEYEPNEETRNVINEDSLSAVTLRALDIEREKLVYAKLVGV
ncbi:hypothetical protein BDV96DRAFT_686215 [Lophiotrema nucula]|uniref:Uncharacterized protein n=1 Tax=Lophiotrema nucula TaxID=690887 RepID=A0A6A5ZD41_9PLEO|nr:hypothetical protein BDV96DRAFT_686215 [Lophiotrema nucula]